MDGFWHSGCKTMLYQPWYSCFWFEKHDWYNTVLQPLYQYCYNIVSGISVLNDIDTGWFTSLNQDLNFLLCVSKKLNGITLGEAKVGGPLTTLMSHVSPNEWMIQFVAVSKTRKVGPIQWQETRILIIFFQNSPLIGIFQSNRDSSSYPKCCSAKNHF